MILVNQEIEYKRKTDIVVPLNYLIASVDFTTAVESTCHYNNLDRACDFSNTSK
jgi:hypothetical protein